MYAAQDKNSKWLYRTFRGHITQEINHRQVYSITKVSLFLKNRACAAAQGGQHNGGSSCRLTEKYVGSAAYIAAVGP